MLGFYSDAEFFLSRPEGLYMLLTMGRRPNARRQLGKFAHPLLQWREKHGVSQDELAEACKLNQSFLSKIENGVRLPLHESLERLRAFTGLPTDAFIRPWHFIQEEPNFLERFPRP